jgi:hypothetical protein
MLRWDLDQRLSSGPSMHRNGSHPKIQQNQRELHCPQKWCWSESKIKASKLYCTQPKLRMKLFQVPSGSEQNHHKYTPRGITRSQTVQKLNKIQSDQIIKDQSQNHPNMHIGLFEIVYTASNWKVYDYWPS